MKPSPLCPVAFWFRDAQLSVMLLSSAGYPEGFLIPKINVPT